MNSAMVQVIDASVAIKWFVREPGQDQALAVLQEVLDHPEIFAVPELFYFELSHIFNRLVPSPNEGQLQVLDQVFQLGIQRFAMTSELYHQVRYFQGLGLSGYDAAYVGLARMTKGIWLSFDQKAHAKIARLRLSRLLG